MSQDIYDQLGNSFEGGVAAFKRGDHQTAEVAFGSITCLESLLAAAMMFRGMNLIRSGNPAHLALGEELLTKSARLDPACFHAVRSGGFQDHLVSFFGSRQLVDLPVEAFDIKKSTSRWPDAIKIRNRDELLSFVKANLTQHFAQAERFIGKESLIVTLGSCFAINVARALTERGFRVNTTEMDEGVTNTFAINHFFRWLQEGDVDKFTSYLETVNGAGVQSAIRDNLAEARVVILTFGVAPALFHETTGEFAFTLPHRDTAQFPFIEGKYLLRTTSVDENARNIDNIVKVIRGFNKTCKIVMTVSPVPLFATNEMESVFEADCISKSTIRLAVHQIIREHPEIVYWPSFEIIRWLGGHTDFAMFGDDGQSRHVNLTVIEDVIGLFIDTFQMETA